MAPGLSLYSVKAVIILADDGSRIFAKYYTPPHQAASGGMQRGRKQGSRVEEDSGTISMDRPQETMEDRPPANFAAPAPSNPFADVKAQKTFEKGLLEKTAKQNADILLYDNHIVLYKTESDVTMYVVGSPDENEVLLYNVILTIRDSLHLLLKQSIDKRTLIECYDILALAMDEVIDDGVILETDPSIVVTRVSKAPTQDVNIGRIDPFSEQGVNQLAQLGRNKISDWLRQGL